MNLQQSPTEKEIKRFLAQKNGDPSFFALAIFTIIESYIRHTIPGDEYTEDRTKKPVEFWKMIYDLNDKHNPQLRKDIRKTVIKKYKKDNNLKFDDWISEEAMKSLYPDMYEIYNKTFGTHSPFEQLLKEIKDLKKLSDRVRHDFQEIEPAFIDTITEKFIDFAKHENFPLIKEIEKIPHYANWDECKAPIDNEQYNKLIAEMDAIAEAHRQDESKLTELALKLEKEARKNQFIEEEKSILQEEKNKLNNKYEDLRQKSYDLEVELTTMKENHGSAKDITKLENELASVKKQKDEQESLLSKKQKEIDTLTENNRSLKDANETYKAEKEKISRTLENTEKERLSIQKEIQELKSQVNQNSETEDKLAKLSDDYNKVLTKEKEQEILLLEKQKEIDALNESYEDLTLMNADLAKQKEEAENKLKEAVSSSKLLLSKIQELEKNPIPDNKALKELEDVLPKVNLDFFIKANKVV